MSSLNNCISQTVSRNSLTVSSSGLPVPVSSVLRLLALVPQTLLEAAQAPASVTVRGQDELHVRGGAVQLHRRAPDLRHQVGRGPHADTPGALNNEYVHSFV